MEISTHESGTHLISAGIAADRAREIETIKKRDDEPVRKYPDIPINKEHASMVISSITSAYTFLEAFVNEVYDILKDREPFTEALQINKELTSTNFTQYNTLSKFQAILRASDQSTFEKGAAPYQEVKKLQRLRNYWVHYEPDTVTRLESPKEEETSFETELRSRVDPNPFIENNKEPFLPRLALSFDCCMWSINSTIEFVEQFRKRVGSRRTLRYITIVDDLVERNDRIEET